MHIRWSEIDEIPRRKCCKYDPTEDAFHPPTRRVKGYETIIRDFDRHHQTAEALYDRAAFSPALIRNSLESARRRLKLGAVRIVTRGDRVFATRDESSRRDYRRGIENTLHSFAVSDARSVTLDIPEGYDARTIYNALHYKRTALGHGDVSVGWTEDGRIRLYKKYL
jgi:hypothetical protein